MVLCIVNPSLMQCVLCFQSHINAWCCVLSTPGWCKVFCVFNLTLRPGAVFSTPAWCEVFCVFRTVWPTSALGMPPPAKPSARPSTRAVTSPASPPSWGTIATPTWSIFREQLHRTKLPDVTQDVNEINYASSTGTFPLIHTHLDTLTHTHTHKFITCFEAVPRFLS